jgi:L-ascorbate metabolism protein UlaG (beta-lactamase superfamily)
MKIRWFGQSAFLLTGSKRVAIDPFPDIRASLAERGRRFDYPRIEGVDADVLLVTHEHLDHNGVEAIGGDPHTVRSVAGTYETPIGEVRAIASEHDEAAGTRRGPNAIIAFVLDGLRFAHFGDFGQAALRREQRDAIGDVDVLILPIGGGPTIGGAAAAGVVRELAPRLVVPMHYRTPAVDFLDPPDAFLSVFQGDVRRLDGAEAEIEDLLGENGRPTFALLAPPT